MKAASVRFLLSWLGMGAKLIRIFLLYAKIISYAVLAFLGLLLPGLAKRRTKIVKSHFKVLAENNRSDTVYGGRVYSCLRNPIYYLIAWGMFCLIFTYATLSLNVFGSQIPNIEQPNRLIIGIFTSQIMILALVFPSIYSTISNLTSSKPHLQNRIKVYIRLTNAYKFGSSVVLLCVTSVFAFFISLGVRPEIWWVLLSFIGVWAVYNTINLALFLVLTSEFINVEKQQSILRTFFLNNVLPGKVTDKLSDVLWNTFLAEKLTPKLIRFSSHHKLNFNPNGIAILRNDNLIRNNICNVDTSIHSVNFKSLQLIIKSALLHGNTAEEMSLRFSGLFSPNTRSEFITNFNLSKIHSTILKLCFPIEKGARVKEEFGYKEIIKEAVENAKISKSKDDLFSFKMALDEFCSLVELGAEAFIIPELDVDLANHQYFIFDETYSRNWKKGVFDIGRISSLKISESLEYFRSAIESYIKLRRNGLPQIYDLAIYANRVLSFQLLKNTSEDESNSEEFTIAIELLVEDYGRIFDRLDATEIAWETARDDLANCLSLLEYTAELIADAALFNNYTAFTQFIELFHFWDVQELIGADDAWYLNETKSLRLELTDLGRDFDEIAEDIVLRNDLENFFNANSVISIILSNYQVDLNLVVFSAIIERARRGSEPFNPSVFVSRFMSRIDPFQEDFRGEGQSQPTYEDLVFSFFRINLEIVRADFGSSIYQSFGEKLGNFYSGRMLSGRSYTTPPEKTGVSKFEQLIVILCSVPDDANIVFLRSDVVEFLRTNKGDPENYRVLGLLKSCLSTLEAKRDEFIEMDWFDEIGIIEEEKIRRYDLFITEFTDLVEQFENERIQNILDAPIRLETIEELRREVGTLVNFEEVFQLLVRLGFELAFNEHVESQCDLFKIEMDKGVFTIPNYQANVSFRRSSIAENIPIRCRFR